MQTRLTVLPWLLALIVAIAHTPTDIFQINAWNVGTAKTEPWRSKTSGVMTRSAQHGRVLVARLLAWGDACARAYPRLASEVGAIGNIKQLIQAETDNRAAIAKL